MKHIVVFAFYLLVVLSLSACGPSATPTPTPDLRATETKIASNIFATMTASAPTATNTATPTNLPTIMPTPTPKSTVTPTRTRTAIPATTKPPTAAPTAVLQDKPQVILDKWQIALVSTRRDKSIFGYSEGETAFGVWATLMFRVKNLQGGSIYIGKDFGIRVTADGKRVDYSIWNTVEDKSVYFYACCDSAYHMLGPGEETVVLYTLDVPENTETIDFSFTIGGIPIYPTFRSLNFQQVPARKGK